MREAIDALHELERQRLEEAEVALRAARGVLDAAEQALARAEAAVLAHDETLERQLAPRDGGGVSPAELARVDAYRRAMRARRETLLGVVQDATRHREAQAGALELARAALADARARARAVEMRLEARALARRNAQEKKAEDEADERRRR